MYICSNVPGNDCKLIPTPVSQFDTYHECAYYGYDYSSILLKEFSPDFEINIKLLLHFLVMKKKLSNDTYNLPCYHYHHS